MENAARSVQGNAFGLDRNRRWHNAILPETHAKQINVVNSI
jgi:hypothetical protein